MSEFSEKILKKGLIGKKLGMSQFFDNNEDERKPITLLECGYCRVLALKTKKKDGYNAVVLGYGEKKLKSYTKPELNKFKKQELKPMKFIKEIRLNEADLDKYKLGENVGVANFFVKNQYVDITGISKGRGFAGVVKKYSFAGSPAKAHEYRRHTGSIGQCKTPGRVMPGKKMPGRMGGKTSTTQNLKIAYVDPEQNVIGVIGAVPGPKNGFVVVLEAKKRLAYTGIDFQRVYKKVANEREKKAKKATPATNKK